jgi:hypothetical protein
MNAMYVEPHAHQPAIYDNAKLYAEPSQRQSVLYDAGHVAGAASHGAGCGGNPNPDYAEVDMNEPPHRSGVVAGRVPVGRIADAAGQPVVYASYISSTEAGVGDYMYAVDDHGPLGGGCELPIAEYEPVTKTTTQHRRRPTARVCARGNVEGGRPCTRIAGSGGGSFCSKHACQHQGCGNSKSNTVEMCTHHSGMQGAGRAAEGALRSALQVTAARPAQQGVTGSDRRGGGKGIQRSTDARAGSVYDGFGDGGRQGGGGSDGSSRAGDGGTKRQSAARQGDSVYTGFGGDSEESGV